MTRIIRIDVMLKLVKNNNQMFFFCYTLHEKSSSIIIDLARFSLLNDFNTKAGVTKIKRFDVIVTTA